MNNNDIAFSIIAGTIVCLMLVIAIILFVIKAHKANMKAHHLQVINNDLNDSLVAALDGKKQLNIERTRLYDQLKAQVFEIPVTKYIKYYNASKAVHVHMIHLSKGIAVISDVDSLKYQIKLLDELYEQDDVEFEEFN